MIILIWDFMINQQIYKYSLNCKGLVWTLDIEVKKKDNICYCPIQ